MLKVNFRGEKSFQKSRVFTHFFPPSKTTTGRIFRISNTRRRRKLLDNIGSMKLLFRKQFLHLQNSNRFGFTTVPEA